MTKTIRPFKDIRTQRIWSILVIMFSIFLILYKPTFTFFVVGSLNITNTFIGIILFLIAGFYFLSSFDWD